jgi:NADH-ubiquinone oxidoreductase chain 6
MGVMGNLHIIDELSTGGFYSSMLDILSLVIIFSGVFIIISKNPIVSVLFLIGLFGGVASYLILIGLSFIGYSYLIVYIGAVSILFLFILMLINIRISELQSNTRNSIPLAIFIGLFFNYSLFQTLPYELAILNNNTLLTNIYSVFVFSKENIKSEILNFNKEIYYASSAS